MADLPEGGKSELCQCHAVTVKYQEVFCMVWTLPQYLAWSICNVTITNRSTWKSGNGIVPNSGNDQALESQHEDKISSG